jgi:hypothetical protein
MFNNKIKFYKYTFLQITEPLYFLYKKTGNKFYYCRLVDLE